MPQRPARSLTNTWAAVALTSVVLVAAACSGSTPTSSGTSSPGSGPTGSAAGGPGTTAGAPAAPILFNGQGNNLDAYETTPPFVSQRVIKTVADDPNGLDINAQICFFPDGSNRFIAGEDTGQTTGNTQGWGVFQLSGTKVGSLAAEQQAKLTPTYQGSKDNAENYGCGFLDDGRLLTTDVGNQALGPGDGQLILWFPPFGFDGNTYCKLDTAIATAQSIWVDDDDNVYVASARPGESADAVGSGVYKYAPPFPTSNTAAGGCGRTDGTGAPLADTVNRTKVIATGEHGMIAPAGLAPAPNGNLYVSSIITGVINEYAVDGTFVRTILEPPAGETLTATPFSTGTPLGIAVDPAGNLYYADIGVVIDPVEGPGPGSKTGSVRKIPFVNGQPQAPQTMAKGLAFPDGLGVFDPATSKRVG